MFGRGELVAGIIVEPIKEKAFDPKDFKKLADFRNEIWRVLTDSCEVVSLTIDANEGQVLMRQTISPHSTPESSKRFVILIVLLR